MKVIQDGNHLPVFHTGRSQDRQGPHQLSVETVGGLENAAVLESGKIDLAADGNLQTLHEVGNQHVFQHLLFLQHAQQLPDPFRILEFRLAEQLFGAAQVHLVL